MSEYTPTTDDVRARYIDNRAGIGGWTRWDESVEREVESADAEFNRWLVEVRREAAEKAWDEGLMAERTALGASEAFGFVIAPEPNPYRKKEATDD